MGYLLGTPLEFAAVVENDYERLGDIHPLGESVKGLWEKK